MEFDQIWFNVEDFIFCAFQTPQNLKKTDFFKNFSESPASPLQKNDIKSPVTRKKHETTESSLEAVSRGFFLQRRLIKTTNFGQ